MILHKNINETRLQEICDAYISEPIKRGKPLDKTSLARLSCTELIALYFNTEWYIERITDDLVDAGLENQLALHDLISARFESGPIYAIYTDATQLPFLTDDKMVLVYTEKRFADMVACSFNVDYYKENAHFQAVEIEKKEDFWSLLLSCGINSFSADGTRFHLRVKDFCKAYKPGPNAHLRRILIQYAQAMRLGIHREQSDAFKSAIIEKLSDNPTLLSGRPIKSGGNQFLPLYTDNLASEHNGSCKQVQFAPLGKDIVGNRSLTGIVLNPGYEHISVPRQAIADALPPLDTPLLEQAFKTAQIPCRHCQKLWPIDKLDKHGSCPDCLHKKSSTPQKNSTPPTPKPEPTQKCSGCQKVFPASERMIHGLCSSCFQTRSGASNVASTAKNQITNTVNRANLTGTQNRFPTFDKPQKGTDYSVGCLLCGLISVILFPLSILTFTLASHAIKEAHAKHESTPRSVWYGVGLSVFGILLTFIRILVSI